MNELRSRVSRAKKISAAVVLAGVASLDARVHAATPGELEQQREVLAPETPHVERTAPPPVQVDVHAETRMRSRGLFGAGLGVGAAGVALLVGGATHGVPGTRSACSDSRGSYLDCDLSSSSRAFNTDLKIVMIGGGGSMVAGGIVMMALGGWQVPLTPRADTAAHPKTPPPSAALVVGPTSASVHVVF